MDKKYQIFVSSTRDDLRDHRDAVMKAILEIGHIPIGMEMFSAADDDSWTLIQRQIDQCDYYLVIVAHRYGSTAADGISYTEKEYDYARKSDIPTIGFIIEDSAPWPGNKRDLEPEKQAALMRFKKKLQEKQVDYWKDEGTLQARVMAALPKLINLRPRPGWIRGTEAAGPEVLAELSRLSSENAELRFKLMVPGPPDLAFHLKTAEVTVTQHQGNFLLRWSSDFVINPRDGRHTAIHMDQIHVRVFADDSSSFSVPATGSTLFLRESRVTDETLIIEGPCSAQIFGDMSTPPTWVFGRDFLHLEVVFRSVGFEEGIIVQGRLKRHDKHRNNWVFERPSG